MTELIILSVPHSGTHFTKMFLKKIGLDVPYVHAQPSTRAAVYQHKDARFLIPTRHPYSVYDTYYQRFPRSSAEAVLKRLLSHYSILYQMLEGPVKQFEFFPLDKEKDWEKFAKFLELDSSWRNEEIEEVIQNWPKVGWKPHERTKYRPPNIELQLRGACSMTDYSPDFEPEETESLGTAFDDPQLRSHMTTTVLEKK